MKTLKLIAAAVALTLGGTAMAQMSTTDQRVMPNGNVRTTNRVETPMGTTSTTRVDRTDGSTRIIHRQTDGMGDTNMVSHERGDMRHDMRSDHDMRDNRDMRGNRGWHGRRTCRTVWHHGHRERNCWSSRRGW